MTNIVHDIQPLVDGDILLTVDVLGGAHHISPHVGNCIM